MSEKTDSGLGAVWPSLETKLRQLAGELTPEEWAQLRAAAAANGIGEPLPSLQAKLQRSVDNLTAEEQVHLGVLLESVALGAAAGAEVDVRGYLKAVYEGPFGWKGRGPDPTEVQPGGSNSGVLDPVPVLGFIVPTAQSLPTWGSLLGQMFGV
jgi:hypothetical protein